MGGLGSGRGSSVLRRKDGVIEFRSIDIRMLKRAGVLESSAIIPSILSWGDGSSLSVEAQGDRVYLNYIWNGRDVRECLRLDWTPVHLGGERPWFLCPGDDCGRRVAILYFKAAKHRCRECYELSYTSRQGRAHMLLPIERCQRVRNRLGGDTRNSFPARPKGMHRSTYARLFEEHQHHAAQASLAVSEYADKNRRIMSRLEERLEKRRVAK